MSKTPNVVDGEASESDSEVEVGKTPVGIFLLKVSSKIFLLYSW